MQQKRYFTLEEANQCIPELTEEILTLQALKSELAELHAELTPMFEVISLNGGDKRSPEYLRAGTQFRQIIERIANRGCHLKGLDPGLIDFPHLRDGKEVYLCWRLGEQKIRYWHETDTGFAGRQRL